MANWVYYECDFDIIVDSVRNIRNDLIRSLLPVQFNCINSCRSKLGVTTYRAGIGKDWGMIRYINQESIHMSIIRFLSFSQITSINIETACLTLALSRRLSDGLQSLPKLQQVIISQPKLVQSFPTLDKLKSIRCLRLLDLPEYVEDWKWVGDIKGLAEIEVSFNNGLNVCIFMTKIMNCIPFWLWTQWR